MIAVVGLLTGACTASTPDGSSISPSSSAPSGSSTSPSPSAPEGPYSLGHFPDAPTGSFSDSTAGALQAVLDAAVEEGLPSVTATVLAADGGAWSGAARRADGVHPVEAGSQFAIGSITKTVIAAEVMRLSEEGQLRLSDPVSEHLPSSLDFDTNGATVEDLLAMESGIPDPTLLDGPGMETDPLREWQAWEILDSVPASRIEPNERFAYSNTNYILLGLVIEESTGTSVAAALRSHVLADPRLAAMVYQPEERPERPLAPFHRPDIVEAGGGYLATKASASAGGGAGCMASDSGTLALFGYLLFGRQLLTEQSLLAMTDFGTGDEYDRYGLGVFDQTNIGEGFGVQAIGNGGWDPGGYSTVLIVLPSEGIVISVMTNTPGDPRALVFPVAHKLASALRVSSR